MHSRSVMSDSCDSMDYSPPGSFSRQEYWSGLPFLPPGDLPNPRIEPMSPASPALAGGFLTTEPPGKLKGDRRTFVQRKGALGDQGIEQVAGWGDGKN